MNRLVADLTVTFILAALSISVQAADPRKTHEKGDPFGMPFVNGAGSMECGQFVTDFAQGREGWIHYYDLLQGYAAGLSAAYTGRYGKTQNLLSPPSASKQPTADSIMLWLNNFCRANPLAVFVAAAGAYIHTVSGIAVPEDWN